MIRTVIVMSTRSPFRECQHRYLSSWATDPPQIHPICRIGFIGTGGVGARHAAVLGRFHDVELVAATDVDPGRCAEFARANDLRPVADAARLVDQDLDAVYVC